MARRTRVAPIEYWWRLGHNDGDEWERFVAAHAGLLGASTTWFPSNQNKRKDAPWKCKRCDAQLSLGGFGNNTGYYWWCRCGFHGGPLTPERYKGLKWDGNEG